MTVGNNDEPFPLPFFLNELHKGIKNWRTKGRSQQNLICNLTTLSSATNGTEMSLDFTVTSLTRTYKQVKTRTDTEVRNPPTN